MRRWAETASDVAATPRTSEKVARLALYLAGLAPEALGVACVFFTGRPFAASDRRSVGVGWVAVRDAVERAAGAEPGAFGAAYNRSSDPGRAAFDLLAERDARRGEAPPTGDVGAFATGSRASRAAPGPTLPEVQAASAAGREATHAAPGPTLPEVQDAFAAVSEASRAAPGPTLPEVQAAFAAMVEARRPAVRIQLLVELLDSLDPLGAMYVVKVLSGDLRIGLREGLLEAAVAKAFGRHLADVQRATMASGDIGAVAVLAQGDRLAEARPELFRPLLPMLASPAADAAEIVARLGVPLWAEDKYDGIRAQLHRHGAEVRLYSRDLHDITDQFPDVADAARGCAWDGILDGELLAIRDGAVLPFALLQNRLGRKAPGPATLDAIPAGYVAFDAIALGDRSAGGMVPLLAAPLAERRARLEELDLPPGRILLGHLAHPRSAGELDVAFDAARARGNEGLVVKDPASEYSPGRRGLAWLKLKKALATLDCVVVGVEVGHGKRHGVLSDYTFAVRDDRSGHEGELVTVGKAYSGLTDAEIATMTSWFEAHTIRRMGRYRLVEPTVVVEVAFDRIQPSTRHASGFAMRFPRIARLRPDKQPSEADTLSAVAALAAAGSGAGG